jgi:hypothetical protein
MKVMINGNNLEKNPKCKAIKSNNINERNKGGIS